MKLKHDRGIQIGDEEEELIADDGQEGSSLLVCVCTAFRTVSLCDVGVGE